MSPISIAIAGATGELGVPMTKVLLSELFFPEKINPVVVLSRNPESKKAQELKALGAEIALFSEPFDPAVFKGIDVFLSVLGESLSLEERNRNAKAAADGGVKVYIPSEFGFDHRNMGFHHGLWDRKTAHERYSHTLGIKVVSIYNGMFIEAAFMAVYGADLTNRVYTSVGSPSHKFTVVSEEDIARSTARVAILAAENPNSVPDIVRLHGQSISFHDMATAVSRESGELVEVKGLGYDEFKERLFRASPGGANGNTEDYVRLFEGTSTVSDFSQENENELVNPGQSLWKWTTIEDYARATKGRLRQHY
ncbi:hypothetical protein FRB99_000105 [Tulasnella sp. 403]|nr:hypothetical protein FRB99_000105 [Tulasnella sp. 403]